jgi:hypothetical protein
MGWVPHQHAKYMQLVTTNPVYGDTVTVGITKLHSRPTLALM